jgi:LmbE family N-acetylglucosaminyl deacetylase
VTKVLDGPGTPEHRWSTWSGLRERPALDLRGATHLVVAAPHPDDEVLGVGGLLATAHAAGVRVEIVAVTDGEASHPRSGALTPLELARRRRRETAEALRRLGLERTPVHRLELPDGRVADHRLTLAVALGALLTASSWCLAPVAGDGHPDHEATTQAAQTACARTGARLVEYPVWLWHWAEPDDPRVPWGRARRIELTPAVAAGKRTALEAFATQIRPLGPGVGDSPILPPRVLARFTRGTEIVFT